MPLSNLLAFSSEEHMSQGLPLPSLSQRASRGPASHSHPVALCRAPHPAGSTEGSDPGRLFPAAGPLLAWVPSSEDRGPAVTMKQREEPTGGQVVWCSPGTAPRHHVTMCKCHSQERPLPLTARWACSVPHPGRSSQGSTHSSSRPWALVPSPEAAGPGPGHNF